MYQIKQGEIVIKLCFSSTPSIITTETNVEADIRREVFLSSILRVPRDTRIRDAPRAEIEKRGSKLR